MDEGIAGAVGAAVAGLGLGIKELVAHVRGKRKTDPDLTSRVVALETEVRAMRQENHDTIVKLERMAESVDELCIARARSDEIAVHLREQLKELRDDLRERRRGKE